MTSLEQIREQESKSHLEMYSQNELYHQGSWLEKPVKTVLDLLPCFDGCPELNVLDLGCGVGRNAIAIAQNFRHIPCNIDCVDILGFAIERLGENAVRFGVSQSIHGIVKPIEAYPILKEHYDWVISVSALEHIDSNASFEEKLAEIRDGIRENGIVCMIANSGVREYDKTTGHAVPAQFEVNLPTEELQLLLGQVFAGWEILKSTVRAQHYDIPREAGVSELNSNVVTFVAKKVRRG